MLAAIAAASSQDAGPEDARAARSRRRDWGRFTRNFIVQGTAAEWALCWMAALRRRLLAIEGRPHLLFFLHDEVMVHSPAAVADDVAAAVREAAAEAARRRPRDPDRHTRHVTTPVRDGCMRSRCDRRGRTRVGVTVPRLLAMSRYCHIAWCHVTVTP